MEGFTSGDGGSGSPMSEDPFSLSTLMDLDNFTDLCSPSASVDQAFASFWASSTSWNANSPGAADDHTNCVGISSSTRTAKTSTQIGQPLNSTGALSSGVNQSEGFFEFDDEPKSRTEVVPRCIPGSSVAERMLRALSLLKECSGGGILAQVWMPVKHGEEYILSTSEQPYLLDQMLAGFREVSRQFTFSGKEAAGLFPGLPGRVFMSGVPEWTSNVIYYDRLEYLRVDYAVNNEVRGSLAVPVFDLSEHLCCAVLELVTTKEKLNFDAEMENICHVLEAVDLKTFKLQSHQQSLSKNQQCAFAEMLDVLRTVCHAHMLPLALTWVPFSYAGAICNENTSLKGENVLCVQESACYVTDAQLEGFLHACTEHHLKKGQGIAGKALLSNHPFFSPNVKGYDIRDYPLAHHARKFGLQAAVAIRLRSTYTGHDDYILEFFLPVNCKGRTEQQLLLNNISRTMQRICRSLRTVSDAEIIEADVLNKGKETGSSSPSANISLTKSKQIDTDTELTTEFAVEMQNRQTDVQGKDGRHERMNLGTVRHLEKKRSTAEKNISLSILRQYFSGSLKDAAKSIGVCPTTLKRICRQHGISRWPSRKINKVNRSLKKIQNVINSVQGVEGSLKYDPVTRSLVAAVSASEKTSLSAMDSTVQDLKKVSSTHQGETEPIFSKAEPVDCFVSLDLHPECKNNSFNAELSSQANITSTSLWGLYKDTQHQAVRTKTASNLDIHEHQVMPQNVDSLAVLDEMTMKLDVALAHIKEHSLPSSSGMTDSSSGSASSCPIFKKCPKTKTFTGESSAALTVKATYKEDTVRFKFVLSTSLHQLLEEIGKRFKLAIGTFQLKYMDDEDEWVMLACDSDLQECVEVLESMESSTLKLLVRDLPSVIGSSGSSNSFLVEP